MINFKGLATGIGSLPLTDTKSALDLILRYVPAIPFWPQLPKRHVREGMLAQFSENLPGLQLHNGNLRFISEDKEKELEEFYAKFIENDLEYFKISPDYAAGLEAFCQCLTSIDLSRIEFIKCQVTGPFTFCSGITDSQDKTILHDPVLMQAMVKGLIMKALWQLEYFKKFSKPLIVFFDEPYLTGVGSAYTPVGREAVIEVYSEIADALKSQGCLIGIHCCGNTDWSMLTDTAGIDIINFDAFNFQERFVLYAQELDRFLNRGGVICWGVVPTQEFKPDQTPEFLAQKIQAGLEILVRKGIDRQLLLDRLLISPACGLGTLDVQKAEGILGLLSQTSQFIRKNL